jgi:hypothetical protein
MDFDKIELGYILGDFLQTHLVTLIIMENGGSIVSTGLPDFS